MFLIVPIAFYLTLMPPGPALPPIISGRNGFNFYALTDRNQNPVLSTSGVPIYEGFRREGFDSKGRPVYSRVNSSLEALQRNMVPSSQKGSAMELPWYSNFLKARVGYKTLADIFKFWSLNPDDFRKSFSATTDIKARLFEQLLFRSELNLDREALKVLKLSAFNPDPEQVRFPIDVSYIFHIFQIFCEGIEDIFVDSLDLYFSKKMIRFNPESQAVDVEIILKRAELRGRVNEIGRIRDLSRVIQPPGFLSRFIHFHHPEKILVKAEIGPSRVRFSLKLAKTEQGDWKIKIADPLKLELLESKKVILLMIDPKDVQIQDGKLIYDEAKLSRQEPPLNDEAIRKIERTLSDPLESALDNIYFQDDFGFSLPMDSLDLLQSGSQSKLSSRLSDLKFKSNGIEVSFDGQFHQLFKPDCVKGLSPVDIPVHQEAYVDTDFSPVDFVSDEDSQFLWETSRNDHVFDLKMSPGAMQYAIQSASLGGLLCGGSRLLWPRSAYTPLLEVAPSRTPQLDIHGKEARLKVFIRASLFQRDQVSLKEKFIPKDMIELAMELPLILDSDSSRIAFRGLENIHIVGWKDEEIKALINLLQKLYRWDLDPSSEKNLWTLSSDLLNQTPLFKKRGISLRNFQANDNGLLLSVDPGDFSWMKHSPDNENDHESMERNLGKTEWLEVPSQFLESKFAKFSWKNSGAGRYFYSWRLKSSSEQSWPEWEAFKDKSSVTVRLETPGRHQFQVKAMNRDFEIEAEPLNFEFFYRPSGVFSIDAPSKISEKPIQKSAESERSEASGESKSVVPMQAKGAFGCSLATKSMTEPFSVLGHLVVVFSLFFLLWTHRRKLIKSEV